MNCVMNIQVISSIGSTQNRVLAAPPHANSPFEPSAAFAAGSSSTENPNPKPIPSIVVSENVDCPSSFKVKPPGR